MLLTSIDPDRTGIADLYDVSVPLSENVHVARTSLLAMLICTSTLLAQEPPPVSLDPRLTVTLFAAAPDIVHPIAADFDAKGRLLVVESHTHFRPSKYNGPPADRIRLLEDTNGDGKADRFTTFFEGTVATMDLAVHPNGDVYVATRNEVIRLRDTDGDGKSDEKLRIAFLETAGNYPHNGLSGLTFDSKGRLYFGMGENLGAKYTLIGADGTKLPGGGEGGNMFHVSADGTGLRRVATGFWNPFGTGRDIYNRFLVADNDPDSSPPCRLLHLVEGADYGFQFRYGRSGRHPFQAWNGELRGTLPMVAGTGESPCEVIAYESDGLPAEYLGHYLVPAWADHRVERYVPRQNGASVSADRRPFIQGGKEFRPSGLTVAPDGSLFVTDWVSRSYELHGKGAVWHVRWKDAKPAPRSADAKQGLQHAHRPVREKSASELARTDAGRAHLRSELKSSNVRVRTAALTALVDAGDKEIDLPAIARGDASPEVRAMAVHALVERRGEVAEFLSDKSPAVVRLEAIAGSSDGGALLKLTGDRDPFLAHAAVHRLAKLEPALHDIDPSRVSDPLQRIGLMLAWRSSGKPAASRVATFLKDADPDVRFLAIKWVSDDLLVDLKPTLVQMMNDAAVTPREYFGLATALARLDNQPFSEDAIANRFADRIVDRDTPIALLKQAIRVVPATHPKVKTEHWVKLLGSEDASLRVDALRALAERADAGAAKEVRALSMDEKQPVSVRAQALVTLAAIGKIDVDYFFELANTRPNELSAEALRGLVGSSLSNDQRALLSRIGVPEASRAAGKPFFANRPPVTDTEAWLKRIEGKGNAEAGRRIFEHSKIVACNKCHRVDGRGSSIGPELTRIGNTERRWVLESLLQPGAVVAPHYQPWRVESLNGLTRTGLLVRTNLDECEYVDSNGARFKVEAKDVAESVLTKGSIMPDGLIDRLTDQEIRDLIAFLESRR